MVKHLLQHLLVLVNINEHLLRMGLNERLKQIAPVTEQHWVHHLLVPFTVLPHIQKAQILLQESVFVSARLVTRILTIQL